MTTTTLAVILIGLFILLLIYWLIRSRGNTTGHIDTTLTALGAATEAVEDIVDAVRSKAKTPPPAETPPPPPAPAAEKAKASSPVETPKSEPKAEKAAAKPAVSAVEKSPKKAPAAKPAATLAEKPAAAPAVEKAPKKAAAEPDNLRQIKGVGPKLATLLTELGVTRFDQIAAWKPADVEKIDAQLGTFKGRPVRDNWVEQAGYLAKGNIAGFEAKFGKLDG